MQALERTLTHPNWITILLVGSFALLTLLSALNKSKLKKTVFAIFDRVFVEEETEDQTSFFSSFNLIISLFCLLTIALVLYQILIYSSPNFKSFFNFWMLFSALLGYFLLKRFLEYLLMILFELNEIIAFFQEYKKLSFYSICFGLFVLVVSFSFTNLSNQYLIFAFFILLLIRFFTIIIYNKNLIFNKLFYFILYLCALEIAPLLLIFKLTP